jgi:hypothetical protein
MSLKLWIMIQTELTIICLIGAYTWFWGVLAPIWPAPFMVFCSVFLGVSAMVLGIATLFELDS